MARRYRQQNKRFVQNKKYITEKNKNNGLVMQGFGSSGMLLLFCGIIVVGFYTYIANVNAVRGIEVHELEKKIAQTENEHKKLSILIAELSTVKNAEEIIEKNNLKQIADIKYIEIKEKKSSE